VHSSINNIEKHNDDNKKGIVLYRCVATNAHRCDNKCAPLYMLSGALLDNERTSVFTKQTHQNSKKPIKKGTILIFNN